MTKRLEKTMITYEGIFLMNRLTNVDSNYDK